MDQMFDCATNDLLCPSAPATNDGYVFGVVGGAEDTPRVAYLTTPQKITEPLLDLSSPIEPTEVFRIAAPCAKTRCQHFDGTNCALATRIVTQLPAVVRRLPHCRVRPSCRWWHQEGQSACFRCPQVVTKTYGPSQEYTNVANVQQEREYDYAK
jgi:hypothetical protein